MKRGLFVAAAALLAFAAQAQDMDAIRERMKARKSEVTAALASQKVGENNKGYLEAVKPPLEATQAKTVTEENADRKTVYAEIAAKTGAKPDAVGRSRAKDVAQKAAKGTMIQKEDGTWVEKQ